MHRWTPVSVPVSARDGRTEKSCPLFVPVGNFQIQTASGWTGGLEPPDFVAARCKALEGRYPTVKYLPP